MTEFNMWTWNRRVFPGIDPLVVRFGDRVRVRIGNLTMTNHPIHLHGAVRGDLHRRRLDSGQRACPEVTAMCRSALCGHSSSVPASRATGRSIATSRTTP